MRKIHLVLIAAILFLGGCGYHNPYAASSGSRPITLQRSLWVNKTGEVGLENTIYQSLSKWLRKSPLIHLVENPTLADYVLSGTIDSVDYPELSYSNNLEANELRVNLHVTFSMTARTSGKKVWTIAKTFTETLNMSGDPAILRANKLIALRKISADIAEMIYLHVIVDIMRPQPGRNN
ncbi:MAG: hypothetical protein GXP59_06090 [Deltaproteobacteria bacterium]|nr:hypothetical protein [Deltaproteobacteria bacterium]